jgi:hypothetical protein
LVVADIETGFFVFSYFVHGIMTNFAASILSVNLSLWAINLLMAGIQKRFLVLVNQ